MSTLIKEHSRYQQWHCYIEKNNKIDLPPIDQLLVKIEGFPNVLKDDRRSLVKLGELNQEKIIAKQPRDKNKRKWARILTLLTGQSEAQKAFCCLIDFKLKGIESLAPYCLLQKKQCGMVIDSYLLYYFREGQVSNKKHLPKIVTLLKKIHQHGYQHTDPHFDNFLTDENGELFLIDCKGKSRKGTFSDNYDFFLLLGRSGFTENEIDTVVNLDKSSWGYRLAKCYMRYIKFRSNYKQKVGRKRSKKDRL